MTGISGATSLSQLTYEQLCNISKIEMNLSYIIPSQLYHLLQLELNYIA